MREARRSRDGSWHLVFEEGGVWHIAPLDWTQDAAGHWPRVDLAVRDLGDEVRCPRCDTAWTLEEMDCVFGNARALGNDLLLVVRCAACRLPYRVRAAGFLTAYPRVTERMEGWAEWSRRTARVEEEECRLYGAACQEEEPEEAP